METRSSAEAYARYLAGMDASMRQKVALTAAYLLSEGQVADLGCGSGACTFALASLYPRLRVVGVDNDPNLVARATQVHPRANLTFQLGDLLRSELPPKSLDAAFCSSVLHHVTSFNGYGYERAAEALARVATSLDDHGVLIVRDFLAPPAGEVLLDVRSDDGDDSDDPRRASTARLLERFATEFRSLSADRGFPCAPVPDATRTGWRRYRLAARHAAEFVLRKDYRADWEAEAQEEYGFFTQAEFEATFRRLGLRVLASCPIRNPWVVRNRFQDQVELRDPAGHLLDPVATNYVIVGERVAPHEGTRFVERSGADPVGFLQVEHYRDRRTGEVRDLVRRPNLTIDVLPWFVEGGTPFVLVRMSYPRPILQSAFASPSPDGSSAPGYLTEPLSVMQTDRPIGQTVEERLASCGIGGGHIRRFRPGATYYPSPGGTQEEVRSAYVAIDPLYVQTPLADLTGFSTSGRLAAVEARQLLRAAQVGGLADARLELNVYGLLGDLGIAAGPWIGEQLILAEAPTGPSRTTPRELRDRPSRRAFERVGPELSRGFLSKHASFFDELDSEDHVLFSKRMEYVLPRRLSTNTVATALLWRHASEVYVGVDDDDLPAAQAFGGNSQLLVAPAFRLPAPVTSIRSMREWTRERLVEDYGVVLGETFELGGRYVPSSGTSPEVVWPLAFEVRGQTPARRPLLWLSLSELAAAPDLLLDGHLRTIVNRAQHALAPSAPSP